MDSIAGGIKKVIGMTLGGALILIVIGNLFINMWPQVTTISGNITAMAGTDLGTTTMKWVFPISLLVFGIAIGIGLIMWALDQI